MTSHPPNSAVQSAFLCSDTAVEICARCRYNRAMGNPHPKPAPRWAPALERLFASRRMKLYRVAYERHARLHAGDSSIGDGDFGLVGQLMLSALRAAGMEPHHSLLDFGCGVGRLALHAIPYLASGRYTGVDISNAMIARARKRCAALRGGRTLFAFADSIALTPVASRSVDFIAAFSVFTHLEAEDQLQYLTAFHRVLRPGGCLVITLLLLDENGAAQRIFRESAGKPAHIRYRDVRNVVTTRTLFESVCQLSGWKVTRWIRHDEPAFRSANGDYHGLGQAVAMVAAAHA